jgi:hypothetical protein
MGPKTLKSLRRNVKSDYDNFTEVEDGGTTFVDLVRLLLKLWIHSYIRTNLCNFFILDKKTN